MSFSGARWSARIGVSACALACVLALCGFAVFAPAAHATRGFNTALTDSTWLDGGPTWIQKTVTTRARVALLEVDWVSVEPLPPPPGADPTNPADPNFNFGYLDGLVREFQGTGIQPAFLVSDAPPWAEASGGPSFLTSAGAWEPNATAYGQVAAALARRYSGSYPDPLHPGQMLPRVRYFQAWAEANFTVHLAPQWTRSGSSWVATGPVMYRNLLNAFYAGIKSVNSGDLVITTGFGPYGDPSPGTCANDEEGAGCRIEPAIFASDLLCLNGQALKPVSCPNPAHFDAMAIDPYEVGSGGPTTKAAVAGDVSVPDLGKLTRIMNKAGPLGRALPRGHKQLWVTEFGYDSNPPNVTSPASLATQARWLDQAFYIFWQEGVTTAVWYLVRDQAATYVMGNYYTGLYFYNGAPKPSLEAFRFPFVVLPNGKPIVVWGVSPRSGSLAVQLKKGRKWTTLFHIHVSAGGVFLHDVSASLHGSFRGVVGGEASVAWRR